MLAKAYEPGTFEKKWYDLWLSHGYFRPRIDPDRTPYVIVMPPPNVTGALHLGHALDLPLGIQAQDGAVQAAHDRPAPCGAQHRWARGHRPDPALAQSMVQRHDQVV